MEAQELGKYTGNNDPRDVSIVYTETGKGILLDDYHCNHCGKQGTPYMAVSDQGIWAFCSWECRQGALKVNGADLTPELQEKAGTTFIGPRPEA